MASGAFNSANLDNAALVLPFATASKNFPNITNVINMALVSKKWAFMANEDLEWLLPVALCMDMVVFLMVFMCMPSCAEDSVADAVADAEDKA